jgi:hypothetical protein
MWPDVYTGMKLKGEDWKILQRYFEASTGITILLLEDKGKKEMSYVL